jgi:uncharacterized protein YodC (DUF2158 family)
MKHHYTNEQIQAAVDAAFTKVNKCDTNLIGTFISSEETHPVAWNSEAGARLHLASELLERLPEPTPAITTLAQDQIGLTSNQQAAVDAVLSEELSKTWTPKVGDSVQLKSGGDVLTVTEYDADKNQWRCVGLTGGCPCYLCVPLACLKPAKEETK